MDQYRTKDPKEILFWREEISRAASELLRRVEELRNQVAAPPKQSFYVYFNWRNLDERGWYQLRMAIVGIHWYHKELLREDPIFRYLITNLSEECNRQTKRFRRTKFFYFFNLGIGFLTSDDWFKYNGYIVPPIREYLGNFKVSPRLVFQRTYSVRLETPKRVKQKVFRRGYDDKGSESSESERARKDANRTEFPYLTRDFLEYLRQVPDPIRTLRSLGYLLEREE